jgi:hypothetical protein
MSKHIHIEIDAEFPDGDDEKLRISIVDHECWHEENATPEDPMDYEGWIQVKHIGKEADQKTVEYITDRLYRLY